MVVKRKMCSGSVKERWRKRKRRRRMFTSEEIRRREWA